MKKQNVQVAHHDMRRLEQLERALDNLNTKGYFELRALDPDHLSVKEASMLSVCGYQAEGGFVTTEGFVTIRNIVKELYAAEIAATKARLKAYGVENID